MPKSVGLVNLFQKSDKNSRTKNGAVKKVPSKRQAAPNGAACKIYVEKGLVQWKNQPFGVIMNL